MVDAFVRWAGELKPGDGLDDTATLCPVVNPVQAKRILAAIEDAGWRKEPGFASTGVP